MELRSRRYVFVYGCRLLLTLEFIVHWIIAPLVKIWILVSLLVPDWEGVTSSYCLPSGLCGSCWNYPCHPSPILKAKLYNMSSGSTSKRAGKLCYLWVEQKFRALFPLYVLTWFHQRAPLNQLTGMQVSAPRFAFLFINLEGKDAYQFYSLSRSHD